MRICASPSEMQQVADLHGTAAAATAAGGEFGKFAVPSGWFQQPAVWAPSTPITGSTKPLTLDVAPRINLNCQRLERKPMADRRLDQSGGLATTLHRPQSIWTIRPSRRCRWDRSTPSCRSRLKPATSTIGMNQSQFQNADRAEQKDQDRYADPGQSSLCTGSRHATRNGSARFKFRTVDQNLFHVPCVRRTVR